MTVIQPSQHHVFDEEKMIKALSSRQERKLDLTVNLTNTRMCDDGEMVQAITDKGQKVVTLNGTALKQTLQKYEEITDKELPVETFLNVLSPQERQSVWNREVASLDVERVIRTHVPRVKETGALNPDGRLAGYANVSTRYKPMDNIIVAQVLRDVTLPVAIAPVMGTVIDTDHSKFRFVPSKSEVAVGEFTPGFEVTNSESGMGALEFFAFIYRKVCSNGMVVRVDAAFLKGTRRIHIGNGSNIEMPDFNIMWKQALRYCEMHNRANSIYVGTGAKVRVLNMAKDAGLTGAEIESVVDTANQFYHGGRTVSDVVGSFTHAAQQYRKDNTRNRTNMELLGGRVLEYLMAA